MQALLDSEKLVRDYARGAFECPNCRHELALEADQQLLPAACSQCGARLLLPKKVGPFWLFRQLGHGGRGSVYLAFHDQHHCSFYAVKVASRKGTHRDICIRSLQHEAHVASDLDVHPNLVTTVSQGADGDEYFMAMEYIEGETLSEAITRNDGLDAVTVLRLGLQLLGALRHIIGCGYLYRDLKPENIILDNSGHPHLCDFGLALPLSIASGTAHRSFEGSPIYVPPERLLVEGESVVSEIYSLGMVLYHAVAGSPYYTADEVFNVIRQHVSEVRMRTQSIKLTRVPRDFMQVLGRMIKRRREERYGDLDAVEAELRRLLRSRAEETTVTFRRPPSLQRRTGR